MNEESEKAEAVVNAMSKDLKKMKIDDPKDWGDSSIKLPGMYSLSQLEAILPGARKVTAEEEYVEKELNIRHNWKPVQTTPIVDIETTF